MSTIIIGNFRVGEDVVVAFAPTTLDVSTVTSLQVGMKPAVLAGSDYVVVPGSRSTALAVASLAAGVSTPAGWTFSLPAAQSALLSPGVYAIDARFIIGGVTIFTAVSALVRLSQAGV